MIVWPGNCLPVRVQFTWPSDAGGEALRSSDVDNPASDLLLRASCSVSNRIIHAASFQSQPTEVTEVTYEKGDS